MNNDITCVRNQDSSLSCGNGFGIYTRLLGVLDPVVDPSGSSVFGRDEDPRLLVTGSFLTSGCGDLRAPLLGPPSLVHWGLAGRFILNPVIGWT